MQQFVFDTDFNLFSKSSKSQTNKLMLSDANELTIFARNLYESPGNTFLIAIEEIETDQIRFAAMIKIITILSSLFLCFCVTICATCLVRACRSARRRTLNTLNISVFRRLELINQVQGAPAPSQLQVDQH
jgi:hypothetical protein